VRRPLLERIWGTGGVRLLLGDAVVLGLLACGIAALATPAAGGQPARAEVEAAGVALASLDLTRDGVREVDGRLGTTRLEVRAGRVRVLASPCPRQECRLAGWIDQPGELLVCLPNEVVVRLAGQRPGGLDGLSR